MAEPCTDPTCLTGTWAAGLTHVHDSSPPSSEEWVETWGVYRSSLDRRVWVPLENGSDTAGVYLAGGIRRIKKRLTVGLDPGTFRWVLHGDEWIGLEVKVPV